MKRHKRYWRRIAWQNVFNLPVFIYYRVWFSAWIAESPIRLRHNLQAGIGEQLMLNPIGTDNLKDIVSTGWYPLGDWNLLSGRRL